MLKHSIIALTFSVAVSVAANAAAITWGATVDNGFSGFNGAELAGGNLALLGTFNITDAVIQANQGNLGFLQSHFTQFDSASIGMGLGGAASNFAASPNFDTTGLAGTQLYYWVFQSTNNASPATSFSTAFADGIFYMDKAVNPQWALPTEGIGASVANDITDLTNGAGSALVSGAHVVVGTFPSGASTLGGAPNFGLVAVVPEPSSALLLGVGAMGLLARRRRNS